MEHKTTTAEFKIEPEIFHTIIQNWIKNTKFSLYEKGEGREIHNKNFFASSAWLAIEVRGENVRLEAWLGNKGLKPEDKPSAWKGAKIPVPTGLAFGLPATYKKEFRRLIKELEANMGGQKISISINGDLISQPKANKETFAKAFVFLAIINFASGALNIFNSTNEYMQQGFADHLIKNGVFDIVLGVIIGFSAYFLKKGKVMSIWLYAASILITVAYNITMGHTFPYFSVLIGFLIISPLWELKEIGELS